jgi:hypothetical protein
MGASFQTMTLSGSLSAAEVQEKFSRAQDDDRYENGHSYSGGFGMADGLEFETKEFENADAAYAWLDENCRKWKAAKAVKFLNGENGPGWMIAAVCAS